MLVRLAVMSVRSAPKSAPKASSRLDHVLKVGMHSAATSSCGGKYALHGNANSDWGILYFDKYERYLEEWKEWLALGWINESEPLPPSGVRPRGDGGAASSSCGGKYALYGNAKSDWGILYFDKYERYLEEWKEWLALGWINESEPLPPSGVRSSPRTFKPSSEAVYQVLDDTFGKERDDE